MAQEPSGSPPTPFSSNSIPAPPSSPGIHNYTSLAFPLSSPPLGSGPAFETKRTVDIAVSISTYSAPAGNGYDVRQYNTPVTTARHSTVSSSAAAASYHSVSVSMGSNTVHSHGSTSSHSYHPSPTASTASGSYCLSPGDVNAERDEYQSEYSGSQCQGKPDDSEEEAEYRKKYGCPSRLAMLQRFLTVDSTQDPLAYMARTAIRSGDVKDGDTPPFPWKW